MGQRHLYSYCLVHDVKHYYYYNTTTTIGRRETLLLNTSGFKMMQVFQWLECEIRVGKTEKCLTSVCLTHKAGVNCLPPSEFSGSLCQQRFLQKNAGRLQRIQTQVSCLENTGCQLFILVFKEVYISCMTIKKFGQTLEQLMKKLWHKKSTIFHENKSH